ncbi:MAG: response regulator [Bacteroidetes bacterium]|nr:response regulator [Bacteroidota bacterium]
MDTKKKILIVDDEETIAWGISKTLAQSTDLGVETAYTVKASQALTMLSTEKYDLVITDIRMPEMSGIDLLKEVKERYPETGVIIMTAYGSTEVQQEASKRGSIYYIEKPFDIKVLKKAISDFFAKKQEIKPNNLKEELTGSEDSFKGNIGSLQLMDVVQMNCLGRITCTLKVADGQKDGIIVFKKGDIVHAETSGMVGKEAFFNIAGWKGGSFDMINEISTQVTILDHWEQLLIEALQVLDDGSQDNVSGDDDFDFDFGQPPSGTTVKASAVEDAPLAPVSPVDTNMDMTPNMEPANDTSNLLERMLKKTNADAAFIMTPDGFVIDRRLTDESLQIDQSGENIARTLSAMIALGENMYSGALDHVVLSFKNKYIIVKAIPNSDLLFVISAPSSHKLDNILPTVEAEAQNLTNLI